MVLETIIKIQDTRSLSLSATYTVMQGENAERCNTEAPSENRMQMNWGKTK